MTREKSFRRRVRERTSKTGEGYAAARSHVSRNRDRVQADLKFLLESRGA